MRMGMKLFNKKPFVRFMALSIAFSLIVPMMPVRAVESFTINGVTISENDARGNCADFASDVLKKVFTFKYTTTTFNNQYNILRNLSAEQRRITPEHTKQFIQAVPLGARIRICASSNQTDNNCDNSRQGHTIVLVARDDVNGTFTTLEGGYGTSRKDGITRKYTYEGFASEWPTQKGYQYFFYVDDFSSLFKEGASGSGSSVQTNVNQKPEVNFQGIGVPQITYGKGQSILGKITSKNATITKIRAYVPQTNLNKTVNVNTTSYSLSGSAIDYAMSFGSLLPGKYQLCFEVVAGAGTFRSSYDFCVVSPNEKITMTGLSMPNIRLGCGAHLNGIITSKGSPINAISCIVHQGTNVVIRKDVFISNNNTYQYSLYGSALDYGVPLGRIRKTGRYDMSFLVILRDGTKKTQTISFNVR